MSLLKTKLIPSVFRIIGLLMQGSLKKTKDSFHGPLEVIFSSPSIKFYAKRKKTIDEKIKGIQITYLFRESDSYFLLYNNVFYAIDSRKDLRKIFPDLRKDIKKESKENEKKFNEDDEGLYLYLIHFIAFKLNTNNA
ncbi:hypothetical protein N7U66_02305 [Lacinutrix neustonica]|uniref:Uncharacterized protein n=1 Tax=Lacinutrix neustonica TaxID=2980107 RepID=A0A9E8SEQ1_9FLAO|nr:hypothetical protein [Lacinutrix neustonica]WAC02554.1 hypothetical protein N7U66_02305 [Lacinutrix neustonica]